MRIGFLRAAGCVVLLAGAASAEPFAVAHVEGVAHGYLSVRSLDGKLLASGDLQQVERNGRVTATLTFRFRDGSLREETTVFTQRQYFRLISNHVVMKGPTFKKPMDSFIDAEKGTVRVRYTDDDGHEKRVDKHIDVPDDLANGLMLVLLKNQPPSQPKATVSMLALTPEPRMVKLEFNRAAVETFRVDGTPHKAVHYVVKVNVPGPAGVVASVLGKTPPDSQVWMADGEAPTFLKAESSAFSGGNSGPMWRLDLAVPTWTPKAEPQARRASRR